MRNSKLDEFDIIILGAGPTGLVFGNLLGNITSKIAIVEKEENVFPIPRATHIDEETMRNFQLTGLRNELEKHTSLFGSAEIRNEKKDLLLKEEIIQKESVHYYLGSKFFDQTAFEKILREGLKRFQNIKFYKAFEAIELDSSGNLLKLLNLKNKKEIILKGKWIIGSDGGRSLVRNSLNIEMKSYEKSSEWVIVDSILKNKDDSNTIPNAFTYYFNPNRLTIYAYGFGLNRRWEFQLNENETMPEEKEVLLWISKFISLDKIKITRIAKYTHNTLVALNWKKENILLAGDAAHMMPPFAGQGLCSGIRDAVNLAWKLIEVVTNGVKSEFLNTYELERKENLFEILKRTLFFSKTLTANNYIEKFLREFKLRIIENSPFIKTFLRKKFNSPTVLKKGVLSKNSKLSGEFLPQFKISEKVLTDDILGYSFSIIYKKNTLNKTRLHQLKKQGFILSAEKTEIFDNWLNSNNIDFAIVRPDKIIFGAGKSKDFEVILKELNSFY